MPDRINEWQKELAISSQKPDEWGFVTTVGFAAGLRKPAHDQHHRKRLDGCSNLIEAIFMRSVLLRNLIRLMIISCLVSFTLSAGSQPKGIWIKDKVEDKMTNETELKKRCPKCSFLGKAAGNGLSYEMRYYSDVDKKTHVYSGHVKWEWTVKYQADSLVPGEVATLKGTISNLSGEPGSSATAWASLNTWGFMKAAPGMGNNLSAGPNSTKIIIGSITVPKGPGINRDGTPNLYFTLTYELSGGNDSRFIKRRVTYKWHAFGTGKPVVNQPPQPPQAPQPAVAADAPSIVTHKDQYKAGEPIVVVFKNLPGFQADWIGIYGAKAYHANEYIEWKYTNGLKEGTQTFNSPRYGPGQYMFRVYENNGYKLLAQSVVFTVVQ